MDSKIIDNAESETCKNILLAVEYTLLIRYYYQSAKPRALCDNIDGPAGRPADNPHNSDWLGDFHRTVPELTVQVY